MTNNLTSEIKFKDKLYGRSRELQQLKDVYHSAFEHQNSLVLIKGASGSGKSSLVRTFAQSLAPNEVYFLTGKQDLSRNNPPYGPLIQAFNQLILELKEGEASEKQTLKSVLELELGNQIHELLDIFPGLGNIVRPQEKPVRRTSEMTFKDRFTETLLKFVNALSFLNRRIIIFIDDLQWADAATIQFINLWLSEGKGNNIFWVGAYREGEMSMDNRLVREGIVGGDENEQIVTVKLDGLALEVIEEMYSDVITMDEDKLVSFCELILQLTGGNPLFIKESLLFLGDDGVLFFNAQLGGWDYDISKTDRFEQSTRTLDFIIRKLELLPEDTVELLAVGSAIGNAFGVSALSAVSQKDQEKVVELLEPGIESRIIESVPSDTNFLGAARYRFTHDKMQNAAYSMFTEDKRIRVHYALGKMYSSSLGYAAQERNIYDIVNQFNHCLSYFDNEKERVKLVEMNLQAGKKAKKSGSYDLALNYFNVAITTIEMHRQEWAPKIIYDVYLQSGEAAYLKSDFVSSVMFYESALKYAETNLQKAKVHHDFLVMYNSVSDMEAAWSSGLKALDYLQVKFPANIGRSKVLVEFFKVKLALRGYTPEKLLQQEDMADKEAEQTMLTLMEMVAAAWDRKPEILGYIVLRAFGIMLQKGNSPIGYFAVGGYGVMLGLVFGKLKEGWEYVKLSGRLTEKYDSMVFHGRGNFAVHGTYSHLITHIKSNIVPLEHAFTFSKGSGDYSISAYSSIILVENMSVMGMPLNAVSDKAKSYFKFMERTANYDYLNSHKAVIVAAQILIKGPEKMVNRIERLEQRIERVNFGHIRYQWRVYYLRALIMLGEKEKAYTIAGDILKEGYRGLSSLELSSIIYLNIINTDLILEKQNVSKRMRQINKSLKFAQKIAKTCPENYEQVVYLIKGLQTEIKGRNKDAEKHFLTAIERAKKYGFTHYAAFFTERLSRLYLKQNERTKAHEMLKSARGLYEKWGALYKVELINKELNGFVKAESTAVFE